MGNLRNLIRSMPFVLAVAMPMIVLWGGVWLVHRASVGALMPAGPDDVFYWQQARAFAHAGFDSGYFVAADQPALAEWAHFYAWGVVTPIFYGTVGRVMGWPLYAVPALHAGLLCAAVGVWLWAARPTRGQALVAAAVLALYPPMMLFSPTSMQEGFQQSLAILAAAWMLWQWRHPDHKPLGWGLLLVGMSLAKVTWAVLFFPYLWGWIRPRTARGWLVVVGGGTALALLAALWHRWTAAPYPYSIGQVAGVGVWAVISERIQANLTGLVTGHALELHLRAIALIILLACAWDALRHRHHPDQAVVLALGWVLLATAGLIVGLYEVRFFRDYRVMASPLLMGLFVLCVLRPRWVVVAVLACLLIWPVTLEYYRDSTMQHVSPRVLAQYQRWVDIWPTVLTDHPDTASPWCRTVLVSPTYLFEGQGILMALPAGVGISLFTLEGGFQFPARSAYVLLSEDMDAQVSYQMPLMRIRPAPHGALYRNLAAPCP